ncbi:alcohol dehydrogenase 1-like [Carex rostrata]
MDIGDSWMSLVNSLHGTCNVARPLKGFTVVICVLVTVALVAVQGVRLAGALCIIVVDLKPNKFDLWARTNLEEIVSEKQCQLCY